jgi:hypothetical protein
MFRAARARDSLILASILKRALLIPCCTTALSETEVNESGKRNAACEALWHSIICMAASLHHCDPSIDSCPLRMLWKHLDVQTHLPAERQIPSLLDKSRACNLGFEHTAFISRHPFLSAAGLARNKINLQSCHWNPESTCFN